MNRKYDYHGRETLIFWILPQSRSLLHLFTCPTCCSVISSETAAGYVNSGWKNVKISSLCEIQVTI